VQVPVDHDGQRGVMDMMAQLLTRMEKLEAGSVKQEERASSKRPLERSQSGDSVYKRVVVCYRCGQEGHFAQDVRGNLGRRHHIRETTSPWG